MNLLKFGLACALLVGSTFAAEAQSRLDTILESGTLRVGTTGDWNPMSMRDVASGDYKGFDIDLHTALAEDMGVKVEFVPTDWKTLVQGIVANKYDVSSSASLSVSRAKVAGYSDPYFEVGTVPLTLKSSLERFEGWDSINKADVRVAVTLGTTQEMQAAAFFPDAEIRKIEAPARDYQEVLAGRADVHITSNIEAATLVKTYPELAIIPVEEARSRRPLAMLVARDDQVLLNFLNHWISIKEADGFFDELADRWMTAED